MELGRLFYTLALEGMDDLENDVNKSSGTFEKLGKVAAKVGKVVVAGVAASASAIGILTKSAVDAYSDYEQLVGGVETLFKDSSEKVIEYAANAYKTAGLSANDYMETVTSFSASLLQGLGGNTELAAEIANLAITDMSDNANKMGTDISMIQNAYQGFAKQNYTMLDNLKLGYGGTQEEMIRLINDSGVLNETISSLDGISFDTMIKAIHAVQDNLGITGTTALEASTTIQGSMSSMKSAWANLLVGLADDTQDFNALLSHFVDSAVTVVGNLLPRIQIIFNGIPKLIDGLVPQIPGILQAILPGLIEGAVSLMNGLVDALPQIVDVLVSSLPIFVEGFTQIFIGLVENLPKIIEPLISALPEIVTAIVDGLFGNVNPAMKTFITIAGIATTAFAGLKAGMAIQKVVQGFQQAQVTLSLFAMQSGQANIAQALFNGTLTLGETLVGLFTGKVTLAQIAQAGMAKAQAVLNAVMAANPIALVVAGIVALIAIIVLLVKNWDKVKEVAANVWEKVKETWSTVAEWFKTNVVDPVVNFFTDLWNSITTIWENIKTVIDTVWEGIKTTISDTVNNIRTTVSNVFDSVKEKISNVFNGIKTVATNIWNGIKTAITIPIESAKDKIKSIVDTIKGFFSGMKLSFPSIKLPHFSVTPSGWKIGDLLKGSIPKLGISWYAKGGILNKPTIFDYDPRSGNAKIGGEAGAEAVAPIDTLLGYIRTAVAEQKGDVVSAIDRLVMMLADYLPQLLNKNNQLVLDTGVLVGSTARAMNDELGVIYTRNERGG